MQIIETANAPKPIGPYSQALLTDNGFLYLSGQIPLDSQGHIVGSTIEEQTRQVFRNIQAVLEAAGYRLSDVVKATVFLQDLEEFAAMNAVYAEVFGNHKPARSAVQVARLPKDVKIEVEVIAYKKP